MSTIAQDAPATRWRPAPLVAASIAIHIIAVLVAILGPEGSQWWALAAVAGNHVVLTTCCLLPRSTLLGPNLTRLPAAAAARGEIALTFDDGPDPEVTPRVLDILEAHGVRATFFGIATRAARHPDVVREIVRRGHAVENHSRAHLATFAMMGPGGMRREIIQAQEALKEISGQRPRFFRPPAGMRSPFLDPVLHDVGLKLATWTRRGFDTQERNPDRVAARLLDGLAAGDILLLHDGHCARTSRGTPVVLEVLPRLLDAARTKGLRLVTLGQAIDP
jgi:peptidoglycan/xylan/chitin deacetylase (PgdA/CDA1 family)